VLQSSCKASVNFVKGYLNLNVLGGFSKKKILKYEIVVPCGQTEEGTERQTGHDDANIRFSQFCEWT